MSVRRFTLGLFLLAALSTITYAQGSEDVIYSRPLHVRHFAGTIVDQKGMWIEYATVELRSPKDHHVLASTFANAQGFFSFDDKKYGKKIEIRAFAKGFNASQYTAMLRPFGDGQMRIVLHVGS
ncbi:MAG TPA: hypothetical protein VHZ52_16245 [Acidobacteriaceae bacterium]|jgi:hypothetical protein|nr:hypothetical protein [Acidobacteriaceae bacterium]